MTNFPQNDKKMTKNDQKKCTFAGGKNFIFFEALSFFCHFSVILVQFS